MAESARERLIASAVELIRGSGVAATSVSDVLARSGLARRTLYLNFPGGMGELIATATDMAANALTAAIGQSVAAGDPVRSITAFATMWEAYLRDSDFSAGCPIVAATLGRTAVPLAAGRAAAAFVEWEKLIGAELRQSGLSAQSAEDLATMTVASIEGAVIMCIADHSATPLRRTARELAALVDYRIRGH